VAARTGAALLVLRQNHTQLAAAAAFQANLASAGAVMLGTVLNQF
ncbi:MAG: chain length determinant protein tyrosine kinase EpsG, partial [Zoogloea sp.]|nr:chain length determinant protein tyrosine kinase EpsG [Zoogloea sp.]